MRRAVLLTATAVLLVGPTALAFFSGGYFDEPRLIAALTAWALVLVVALTSPQPLPASRQGRAALAGLVLIAAWTGISLTWAPLSEPASASLVRLVLYVGALLAAMGLLRDRLSANAVEPALALGAVVVIGYGLAGRLLPGVVHLTQSTTAFGRLEQPVTYWNAEGALAAIGLVLCARLAGTESRPVAVRVLAASASAVLGMGVYLTFSRGAIAVAVVGLIVLMAAAPVWAQWRAACVALAAAVAAAVGSAGFSAVTALEGSAGRRQSEGAIVLGILVLVMVAAGLAQSRYCAAEARGGARAGRLGAARRLPALAAVAVALGLVGLVVGGLAERGDDDELSRRQGATRLGSIESARYDYWRVGLRAFARHPLDGVGAAGFRVEWLRERPIAEPALEVHSLPLEMATELGIPGLLGFGLLLYGAGVASAHALRRRPVLAPGLYAGATVWLLHSAIDWDWQMPAVTLPAIIMAGALIAASEVDLKADASRAATGPARDALSGNPAGSAA